MGTSGSTSGSGSNTPLIPSWLNGSDTDPLPGGGAPLTPNDDSGSNNDEQENQNNDTQSDGARPPIPPVADPERFRSARANFSRFAGSGGSDRSALKRAVRDYARKGTGGSRGAVQRMGPSRAAASNALGVFRGFQRDGVQETLLRLNLQNLAGKSVQDIFIGLTDVICKDGGPIDEAIARDAWLETIAVVKELGIDDLETLTAEQIKEVFLNFIAHSVESRIYQEIGVNGFTFAEDMDDIKGFDEQLRDYIERSVRDSFTGDLAQLSALSDKQIRETVDKTYREAWELLLLQGDQE